jgi:NAD(P)-dependent dehydrogenase (short-subunit alcohol dehydrogenase family)
MQLADKVAIIMGGASGIRRATAEAAKRPLARVGSSEEIARAALYPASDASSFVTGTALVED